MSAIIECMSALFAFHRWKADSVDRRIVGHDAQAIWTSAYTENRQLWGQLGRKVDPTGTRRHGVPVLDIQFVRREVARRVA